MEIVKLIAKLTLFTDIKPLTKVNFCEQKIIFINFYKKYFVGSQKRLNFALAIARERMAP